MPSAFQLISISVAFLSGFFLAFLCLSTSYLFPKESVGADLNTLMSDSRQVEPLQSVNTSFPSPELLDVIQQSPINKGPTYLSACLIQKNDPYVLEWVVYHYLIGFEHFYIYDDNSTSLKASQTVGHLEALGLVTIISWEGTSGDFLARQHAQINDCWKRARDAKSRWVLNFDTDELVVLVPSIFDPRPFEKGAAYFKLHNFLSFAEKNNESVVLLDRPSFGCSGNLHTPEGLQMESFTTRGVFEHYGFSAWTGGKPFLLIEHAQNAAASPHFGIPDDGWKMATAVHLPISLDQHEFLHVLEPVRLNHYVTRSYEECLRRVTEHEAPVTWRKTAGIQFCDANWEKSGRFNVNQFVQDTVLSASDYVLLVRHLMVDFGSH